MNLSNEVSDEVKIQQLQSVLDYLENFLKNYEDTEQYPLESLRAHLNDIPQITSQLWEIRYFTNNQQISKLSTKLINKLDERPISMQKVLKEFFVYNKMMKVKQHYKKMAITEAKAEKHFKNTNYQLKDYPWSWWDLTLLPLVWKAVKFCWKQTLGRLVSNIILVAKAIHRRPVIHDLNTFYVETADGAMLETLEAKTSKENSKYIIKLGGNGTSLSRGYLDEVDDYNKAGFNLILFSHRGIENSSGNVVSENDMIRDGVAQVARLLDQNVQPDDIILEGHSLGGNVGAAVSTYFYKRGIEIKIMNDRSFSTIGGVLTGKLVDNKGMYGLAAVFKFILNGILSLIGWPSQASKYFKSLPKHLTTHKVARSDESWYRADGIISHYGGMHMAFKYERRARNKKLKKAISDNPGLVDSLKELFDLIQNSNKYSYAGLSIDEHRRTLIAATISQFESATTLDENQRNAAIEYLTHKFNNRLKKYAIEHCSGEPQSRNKLGHTHLEMLDNFFAKTKDQDVITETQQAVLAQIS